MLKAIIRDLVNHYRVAETLRVKTRQLDAVLDAMEAFLENGDFGRASARLLREALRQTESEYGFIGVVVDGPVLRILAHEGIVWSKTINREFYENALRTYREVGYLEFTNFNNLFGRVITGGKPLISNNPDKDRRSGGLPPGHPPLRHFLGVPMLRNAEVVGMIGVANRPGGYTGQEQAKLQILSRATGVLYDNYRRRERESALETQRKRAEAALLESEEKYRQLFEVETDTNVIFDAETLRIEEVNSAALALLGYSREELLELKVTDISNEPEKTMAKVRTLLSGELASIQIPERYLRKKDGTVFPAEISAGVFLSGGRRKIISAIRDITERKAQEDKILRLNRIREVRGSINAAIIRAHNRGQLFEEACRIAVKHGQFGMAWIGLLDPETMEIEPVASNGLKSIEFRTLMRTARGDLPAGQGTVGRAVREKRPVFCNDIAAELDVGMRRMEALQHGYHSVISLPLIVNGASVGVLVLYAQEPGFFDEEELRLLTDLASDVSFALDHIEKEKRLNYLAYYDALTGLPNRALFDDRLRQYLEAAAHGNTSRAILVFDLQRFSHINDTLGRYVGDALLREVSARLNKVIDGKGTLARVGADSFALALAGPKSAGDIAHFIEEVILKCFDTPFRINGHEIRTTIQVGVAMYPPDGKDAEILYRHAEAALKEAEKSGETYLFYAPEMSASVAQLLSLENRLRRAVEERQFVLHYQPIVDSRTGRITGLEGLVRWNDPETDLVQPRQFISVLEETGLIREVGSLVMREAVSTYRRWREKGMQPPRIAVNVSPFQLRQSDFVKKVREAIAVAANADHGLDLEITESVIMENIEQNVAKLREVKELGVGIAIDDFGTGYSSLNYIARLPIDALKIDRSFIIKMSDSPDDVALVSTIISLAHNLGLKVVAEGVDSEDQAKLLRLLRCDEMQGFLFYRPEPLARIEEIIAKG